jgi:hypothetical protein
VSCGNYAEKLEMAIEPKISPSFARDRPIQYLDVGPTVGQLNEHCAATNILSFDNRLASTVRHPLRSFDAAMP